MNTIGPLDMPETFECRGKACPAYNAYRELYPDMVGAVVLTICKRLHSGMPTVSLDTFVRSAVEGVDCGLYMFEQFTQDSVELERVLGADEEEGHEDEDEDQE